MTSGAADQAQNWQELTASQRASYVQEYNAAGISLIVSAFGSTETPTSSGVDPTSTANTMANWVITYGANGIDVDYEVLLQPPSTTQAFCSADRDFCGNRTLRHSTALKVPLSAGSSPLLSNFAQSSPKDSIFSLMPVGFYIVY